MNNPYQKYNKSFQQVELQDKTSRASPHELINMLYQGAKMEIRSAIIKMEHNQIADRCAHISKAIKIVGGLKSSINSKAGGELSTNLTNIYDYVLQTLLEANIEDSSQKLEECYQQISEIASAWNQIKPVST